jgi:hypothetical protein
MFQLRDLSLDNLGNNLQQLQSLRMEGVDMKDLTSIAEMAVRNPKVALGLLPSAVKGLLMKEGRVKEKIGINSSHDTFYDFTYSDSENKAFDMLYQKAIKGQWASNDLAWDTDVDPHNPEIPIFPEKLLPMYELDMYQKLDKRTKSEIKLATTGWMLSQFLHGEQGALYAAGQTVEATPWFSAKLYGSTQVMDEGRHVEVFHKYITTKLDRLYYVNDNLYTVIHALTNTGDWDLKFLGMQIMIEGLALGAFGMLYKFTEEPLLKELLKNVISDEARHVHYGVEALKDFYTKEASETLRREREDWAYEVALMLRNRFLYMEIHEEYFAHKISRDDWIKMVMNSNAMSEFRRLIFSRMIPNLKAIGLLSDRIRPRYEEIGLLTYEKHKAANQLTLKELLETM